MGGLSMYLNCSRVYIGGAKLAAVRRFFPKARAIGGRVYCGYDNASGAIYRAAESAALAIGGYVETESDDRVTRGAVTFA